MTAQVSATESDRTRSPSSRRVLGVSFAVDLLDVATNLVVAILTGSAVVFAELAQGIADSAGSGLLVVGERRAARPRDAKHPFGYAREAFFWGLLSAVVMLVVGAGLSAWRGYQQLVAPEPLRHSALALAVLGLAIVTNGYAVSLSVRKITAGGTDLRTAFREPNRPLVKGALIRDAVGTFTSIVGLIALVLYAWFEIPAFDAFGALAAAVMMSVGSVVLMAQARALITGRSLPDRDLERLRAAISETPEVVAINHLVAIYAGASEVVIDTDLDLAEGLDTARIESVLDQVEARARVVLPTTERIRVLLNSPETRGRVSSRP